jgi:hypothetical protein
MTNEPKIKLSLDKTCLVICRSHRIQTELVLQYRMERKLKYRMERKDIRSDADTKNIQNGLTKCSSPRELRNHCHGHA